MIIGLTILAAAATIFFGVIPSPLVEFTEAAGESLSALFS